MGRLGDVDLMSVSQACDPISPRPGRAAVVVLNRLAQPTSSFRWRACDWTLFGKQLHRLFKTRDGNRVHTVVHQLAYKCD